MNKVKINKDKNIGRVIFVVEGSKYEINIIKKIFTKIFDYELIVRRNNNNKYLEYNSKLNDYSKVFLVNAEESALKHIGLTNEYMNNLMEDLILKYDFSIDNASIYYIFDRDPKSNKFDLIKNLHTIYYSALDNGFNRSGLLLLSYPSMEAFTVTNYLENAYENYFELGRDLKCWSKEKGYIPNKITEETLCFAFRELISAFKYLNINYSDFNIDDMKNINNYILCKQEDIRKEYNGYALMSLFILALFDLGLIEY